MNEYQTQKSPTYSLIIPVVATLAMNTCLLRHDMSETQVSQYLTRGNNCTVITQGTSSTYEPRKDIQGVDYTTPMVTEFKSIITDFFEKLALNQESLGREFEQILFENLWDLYQG